MLACNNSVGPPDLPTGLRSTVMSQSVRLSWNTVSGADSYSVSYTRATDSGQVGLCQDFTHSRSVISDDNMAQIDMDDNAATLYAFSTYSYTVRAMSDRRGNSDSSLPERFTTPQIGN